MNVLLREATIATYLEYLAGYPEEKIDYATNRTIQEWDKPSMMPTVNFILIRCAEYSAERNSRAVLNRPDKPPDWMPDEASRVLAEIHKARDAEKELTRRT